MKKPRKKDTQEMRQWQALIPGAFVLTIAMIGLAIWKGCGLWGVIAVAAFMAVGCMIFIKICISVSQMTEKAWPPLVKLCFVLAVIAGMGVLCFLAIAVFSFAGIFS